MTDTTEQQQPMSSEAIAVNLPALAARLRADFPDEFLAANPELTQLLTITANTLDRSKLKPDGDPALAEVVRAEADGIEKGAVVAIAYVTIREGGNEVALFHSGSHLVGLIGGLDTLTGLLRDKIAGLYNQQPSIEQRQIETAKSLTDLSDAIRAVSKRLDKIKGV